MGMDFFGLEDYSNKPISVDRKGFFLEPTIIKTSAEINLAYNEVVGPAIASQRRI